MALFNKFHGHFEQFRFATVLDPAGKPQTLGQFWKDRTAILIFLRHFGCIACRAHAKDVWSNRESLEKGGARIVFIGNGTPHYIQGFKSEFGLGDAPVYTDPSLKAFAMAGFKHGLGGLLNPKSAINVAKLTIAGHKNGNPLDSDSGSNRQLGGVIVVHPNNRVTYHYISEAVGDVPEASEIPLTEEAEPSVAA